eukprot:TRINITY_DN7059_c0_g2_i1.p1 TRINITY_DN7059_c0_g2~~TRINITY_DN7059_c0_g2_i1.p1  ORF type:complete len:194 (+),score=50.98 TRINITY_DN7059_c0_g2_i1:70-651(+)
MKRYEAAGRTSHVIKTFCLVILMILDLYFCFHIFYVDVSRTIEDEREERCQSPCDISTANDINFSSESKGVAYVIGAQAFVYLMLIFWLFFSIWQTFLFRFRAGQLCKQFAFLFITYLISIALFAAEIGLYIDKLTDIGNDAELTIYEVWTNVPCMIVYALRRVVMVVFYGLAMKANIDLGHPDYYRPQKWLE